MRRESAEFLQALYEAIWQGLGAAADEAQIFARCFVRADLTGRDTQGIAHVPTVYATARRGAIRFGVPVTIVKEGPGFAIVDGGHGPGQVVATRAMEVAIQKAREATVGSVWVHNGNDFDMAANYSEMALRHDYVGVASSNGDPHVAPWGGRDPVFGTCPMSYAIPAAIEKPIIFDGSMSSMSHGAVVHAARDRVRLPGKWLVDEDGHFTDDPAPLVANPYDRHDDPIGAILPLGPKGFGWLIWIEVLAGIMSGMSTSNDISRNPSPDDPWSGGLFLMAINVGNLVPIDEFKAKVDGLIRSVKASRLAEGFSEILMPGERAMREQDRRQREGVPIPEHYWTQVSDIAGELGIDVDALRSASERQG